jgi:hypothetical protein
MATDGTGRKFVHLGELARTVAAILGVTTMIGAPIWKWWLSPMLVASVSTAMAQDIQQRIDKSVSDKIAPINTGLKALIQGNISKLRERINALEYKRDFMPNDWTNMDREELFNLNEELALQQSALNEILSSERR